MKKSTLAKLTILGMSTISVCGQGESYTFQNGIDSITWPTVVPDGDCVHESVEICNDINNSLMFTANYVAAGNATGIDGPAMWGNPLSSGGPGDTEVVLNLNFNDFFDEDPETSELLEQVDSISFDFAWASAAGSPGSPPPLEQLSAFVVDYDGNAVLVNFVINTPFSHGMGGSGVGKEAFIQINAAGLGLGNINAVTLDLSPVAGSQGEFALDNLNVSVNGSGGGGGDSDVVPVDYDGSPATDYSTNVLKNTGTFGISDNVRNDGGVATTFSISWVPSDPLLTEPSPQSNTPIDPGETLFGVMAWEIDTNTAPSGIYDGTFTLSNDGNPSDPDEMISLLSLEVFDPPILTDNTGTLIDLPAVQQISMSNAAAGPHAGALRAAVKVTGTTFSNPRFSQSGIAVDDRLDPAGNLGATISFNPVGAPAGTHVGTFRLETEMTASPLPMGLPTRNFLNNKQPVPARVWNLQATVAGQSADLKSVLAGENIGEKLLNVSDSTTGGTIADGTSGENQDISLTLNGSPPAGGSGSAVNTAIDVGFTGSTVPLYVLEIAYQDSDVPPGFAEQDLRIEFFNGADWVPAISVNSDPSPPTGADPYAGSYAAFLAELGGAALDAADLSAFGVDTAGNRAWAVLDHASTFRLTAVTSSLPPIIYSVAYDPGTNTATITYQSLPGEVFSVSGGPGPDGSTPLPDTDAGDGTIKQYFHQPPGNPGRYFYKMARP